MSSPLLQHVNDHAALVAAVGALVPDVEAVGKVLCDRLAAGGVLYTCGNGGSAADAQHLAGELVGRFRRERPGLAAVALSTDPSVLTCIANDYSYDDVFARQVTALATERDVVAGFTTSGRSPNVRRAFEAARARGAWTVAFTGSGGAGLADVVDQALVIPSSTTARVQEMHLLLLHLLSEYVDHWATTTPAPSPTTP